MSRICVSRVVCVSRGAPVILGRIGCPARALLLLALAAALLTPAKALASSGWSAPLAIMGHDLRPGSGLGSVSCPSASFCVAVGTVDFYAYEPQKPYGIAVTYNGGSWSAPAKLNAGEAPPRALSCSSSSFCLALDSLAQSLTYNGSSWSAPIPLSSSVAEPRSVSCVSATFCVAVADAGEALQVSGSGGLTYNGSSWSAPTGIDNESVLYSVSCASVSFCAAVGGGPQEPVNAVIYNGSSWSAPDTIDGRGYQSTSVSCPSPSFCVAVDEKGDALTYNGHSWSAPVHVASVASAAEHELEAVSCASPSFCAAVGETTQERGDVLTYNGHSWSAPTTIDSGGGLSSVSCPSASFCVAVDHEGNALSYSARGPTAGYERRPSLRVGPQAVRAGGHVLVSGSIGRVRGQLGCPVGDQVDLFSGAFAPSRHEFAGVPTVYAKVNRNGSFSARAGIPAGRHPRVYVVSGRAAAAISASRPGCACSRAARSVVVQAFRAERCRRRDAKVPLDR